MQYPTAELQEIAALEADMLASDFWANMRTHLDGLTIPVQNIVCIALGTCFEGRKLNSRHALQHILACSISSYLSSSSPAIPIFAHDPDYKLTDMHVFSHLSPPIIVLSDPYHYLEITPSTLLICISIPAFIPVFEITADICHPSGPAAILSNEIYEFPWHKEGKTVTMGSVDTEGGEDAGGVRQGVGV
jgi:hypothetical protein